MSAAKSISRGPEALGRLHVSHLLAAVVLVAGLLASPFAAAPAHAMAGDLACTVTGNITFAPGLTATGTSMASVTGNLDNCTSPNGSYPTLTSGTFTGSGTATGGGLPCGLIPSFQFSVVVTWATSPPVTSTINLTLSLSLSGLQLGASVASGQLAGDTVVPAVLLKPNLNCIFVGLTSLQIVAGAFAFN